MDSFDEHGKPDEKECPCVAFTTFSILSRGYDFKVSKIFLVNLALCFALK
jgi:hypothetical protein